MFHQIRLSLSHSLNCHYYDHRHKWFNLGSSSSFYTTLSPEHVDPARKLINDHWRPEPLNFKIATQWICPIVNLSGVWKQLMNVRLLFSKDGTKKIKKDNWGKRHCRFLYAITRKMPNKCQMWSSRKEPWNVRRWHATTEWLWQA